MAEDDLPLSAVTRELVRLVELDYERTTKFIEGVIGTAGTARSLLLTAWSAVIALAFDTSRWTLAAAGFVIVVVSGLLDVYHSWVYNQALGQATKLEEISQQYHTTLARGADDPYSQIDLKVALNHHHFGVYSNIHEFSWKKLSWQAFRPKVFFQVLYPGLLLVSIVVAAVLASTATTQKCYSVEVQGAQAASASTQAPGTSISAIPPTSISPASPISPGEHISACIAQAS
jgi:hypothetical protein